MVVSSGANAMGSTAAQIHAAIVKGTEGPFQALAQANEQTWLLIGKFNSCVIINACVGSLIMSSPLSSPGAVSEQLSDTGRALVAYENALKHNPMSVSALTQVAGIARSKEEFGKAIDYYQRTLNISQENGEVWGSLGEHKKKACHCRHHELTFVILIQRPLLLDDGRPAEGIHRLPTGIIPIAKPEGTLSVLKQLLSS
jgi:tetratricopeptide (TPR) repeat protein